MTLELPAGVRCKVYDLFGNETKTAEKTLALSLDRLPQIIEWPANADPVTIHRQGNYAPQQDVVFHGVKQTESGIALLLSNRTANLLSGFVNLNSQYLETTKTKFANLEPYASSFVLIPATLKADAPQAFEATAVCGSNGRLASQKLTFQQVPVLRLNQEHKLGPHSFTLEIKGDKLLLNAFLRSKKATFPTGPDKPWTGDSIECFCDFSPLEYNPSQPERFTDDCVQFVIPASSSGTPDIYSFKNQHNVKMTDVTVVRSEEGAQVTASIPYRKGMNVNFHFNAEGKSTVLNGQQNFKNRSGYAVISTK